MKAHLSPDPRTLLLWNYTPDAPDFPLVAHAARDHRLKIRHLTPADLGTTVADLCAGKPGKPAPLGLAVPLPATPALIVSGLGLNGSELNTFLDQLERNGVRFPVRAAVTPTSRNWTLHALLGELSAEHQALGGAQ